MYTTLMQIFIFGDSITSGMWDTQGGWADQIKQRVTTQCINSHFEIDIEVYNLGISGNTSRDLLYRFELEIRQRKDETESIIVIAIGLNDSQYYTQEKRNETSLSDFKNNLEKLLYKAKQFTSNIIFVGLTPVDDNLVSPMPWKMESSYRNEDIEKYNNKIKEFCAGNKLVFVDIRSEFKKTDYMKLLADGVHPNTQGHELMYKLVWEKIQLFPSLRT
ncbi:MAG: Lysophospholipase L1 and related esterases family [Microgenomates group bacterium GW2011_GWC1_41_8]|uniref:Lysophospholipase L1 and related esterases family n=3 Tax=Candidatus Roizmaniibacteriota TaxID=1752723 RepID=A0A0G0T3C4_9BACT|nr:MAG: Lysophospholipase L1 and related esterases family [Candidatus Roizmanbacteria bacterium GW2011_GWB1_40_7]KKR94147.1 MAG: Lysophospholipase L1 and related esterases family [Candidatus Roizmanbacteria bacterium GW2011_GWA1_41_13]KKS23710.1 MAG: Lysophospholipase L1 and related esterases family [Microgenomates group bacterium GW2011_GWC1_41_8]